MRRAYKQKKKGALESDDALVIQDGTVLNIIKQHYSSLGQSSIRLTSMYRQLQSIDDCNFAISMR